MCVRARVSVVWCGVCVCARARACVCVCVRARARAYVVCARVCVGSDEKDLERNGVVCKCN